MQVSAHFPPDFVSGGALVPQRLAQAASAAGYESSVFSGQISDLPALAERDTRDGAVNVHWVGTSPYLAWDDRKNFDNPEVAEKFRAHVRTVRPDIVHFHSIQTLGAQIIDMAHEAGASVVLTMHDFWWICARQFLVDSHMKPCPLVVNCGECQCSRNHLWLEERTRWLFERLRNVDLILAPSRAAADELIANGIPDERVRVNENGIDGAEGRSCERQPFSHPVRMMYAGGEAELKGYRILQEAARLAKVPEGTRLDLYNASSEGFPAWVDGQPPYGRDQIDDVFAAHDVLILPSIMRESHSIVTREALSAGMAVVCTDTLGPEEAIVNFVNGMIVPAGSPESLARSIEWIADPARCSQVVGRGSASPIVSVSEQVDEILAIYREIADEPRRFRNSAREGIRSVIENIVYVVGLDGAPTRYRAHLPSEALETRGIHSRVVHYRDPRVAEVVLHSDAVVFYRVPATDQILDLIRKVRAEPRVIPVLGDVDDLIFDPSIEPFLDNLDRLSPDERALWLRGIHRYRTTLENCDVFIGSTTKISDEASRLMNMPAWTFSNGVGAQLAIASERALEKDRGAGPLRVGYFSGTDTHDADWASIEDAVASVMDSYPDVELWLGGLVEPTRRLEQYADRIVRVPFLPWYELPRALRNLDVCLAPLTANSMFNEAKSAIKWLEAALVETPTIASGTEPFARAIAHGEDGFIANTSDEWRKALELLLSDSLLRHRVGAQAKRKVLMNYSPDKQGFAMEKILENAWAEVALRGHRSSSNFPFVTDDEPFNGAGSVLEPYQNAVAASKSFSLSGLVRILRANSKRFAEVSASDGLVSALRRVVFKLASKRVLQSRKQH